ncbi:MAG: RHS repeat-associated core domain-containing protein [Firmicutes bacterium]|nr:RHS repeat-associated core domain-containing protein [Bacillota bacterium]
MSIILGGKVISINDTSRNKIGEINPLRYRSYYYDTETELYYLNSRFYDTETGRFINADGYISTDQGINDKNMYIYCGNNPVSRKDQDGMFWKEIGNFFGTAAKAVVNCIKAIFGAETTVVYQVKKEIEPSTTFEQNSLGENRNKGKLYMPHKDTCYVHIKWLGDN